MGYHVSKQESERYAIVGGFASIVTLFIWVAGVVIANGFWSTLFAVFIPFWSFYLVVERLLIVAKII
jgi:uncharacterized membrane protein